MGSPKPGTPAACGPPVAALKASPGVLTGIALTAAGYALFSIQDASVKWLVEAYAVPQVLFLRSIVIVALVLAIGGRRNIDNFARSRNKVALIVRAALILGAWLFYYSAARYLGLPELTTFYFAAPIIAVGLSATLLKERVGTTRWLAVLVGFGGVVVAAGPSVTVEFGPALAALVAAACWGSSVVLVRWINRSDTTPTQMLVSNLLFALSCLFVLPWLWKTPDPWSFALMIGLGFTGGLGQYLIYEGFRFAPASVVAPIEYTGLVWAFLYGYAIWDHVPAQHVFAGAGLIIVSALMLVWFEGSRSRAVVAAPTGGEQER